MQKNFNFLLPEIQHKIQLRFKMKLITTNIITLLFIMLAGCSLGATMPQQVTSMNVECDSDDVEISNQVSALNGEETWTAECDGKTYNCTYLDEAGSNCYENTNPSGDADIEMGIDTDIGR